MPGLHFEVQQMRMDLLYSSKFFQRKLPEVGVSPNPYPSANPNPNPNPHPDPNPNPNPNPNANPNPNLTPSVRPMLARHDTMLPRGCIMSSAIRMRTCTRAQQAASATGGQAPERRTSLTSASLRGEGAPPGSRGPPRAGGRASGGAGRRTGCCCAPGHGWGQG